VVDIIRFTRKHGLKRLYGGFLPLWLREIVYVTATTVLNPYWTSLASEDVSGNCAKAFVLGFSAGMLSAPFQTLSVVGKDERGLSMMRNVVGSPKRLFFGSLTRSIRTGMAGILWFLSRKVADEQYAS
jgi:hypothetical protein